MSSISVLKDNNGRPVERVCIENARFIFNTNFQGDPNRDTYKSRERKGNVLIEDEEFARWASNHNRKWNDSNFFISENPGALSNCCRLISDTTQLDPFINSIGGTALSVGSVKVSTINLEAIAFEYPNNEDKFIEKLNRVQYIDMCALDRVRHIIQRNIEKKLLPNFIEGGVEMDKLFNTVGFLGLYEVMDIYGYIDEDEFGYKSYSDKGIAFAQKIFDALNKNKEV